LGFTPLPFGLIELQTEVASLHTWLTYKRDVEIKMARKKRENLQIASRMEEKERVKMDTKTVI
jgi:hypothetical protein